MSVVYGLAFGAKSGIYSDFLGLTTQPAQTTIRAGLSLKGALVLDSKTRLGPPGSRVVGLLHGRISGLEQVRYHGLGNQSPVTRPGSFYAVEQYQYMVAPSVEWHPGPGSLSISVGPVLKYVATDADIDDGRTRLIGDPLPPDLQGREDIEIEDVGLVQLMQPYGAGGVGQLGFQGSLLAGHVQLERGGARGVTLALRASAYPAVVDIDRPFISLAGKFHGTYTLVSPSRLTLGMRVHVAKLWGSAPFYELAYVGGGSSLRGFAKHRFGGDAAVSVQSEAHLKIGEIDLIRPLEVGLLALADGGRVFLRGKSLGGWHTGTGGGFWIRPSASSTPPLSLALARGAEGARLYLRVGWP